MKILIEVVVVVFKSLCKNTDQRDGIMPKQLKYKFHVYFKI